MRHPFLSRLQFRYPPKLLLHLALQIIAFEPLQHHPHTAVSAFQRSHDPRVVGGGGFADDVEAGVGLWADEGRVEGGELAGAEESVCARGVVVHCPVEALLAY